ncbi:unnamed protein product [Ambrosiozyma monospora]|uniref:Unnamed protein product n=1 Tax=Ambrosiozyma monospora TaxID=43982 RepID=A0A9W7DH38_AMBMO|nr:unnamed protein product [Ambrosiozyma monospora]
MRLSLITTVLFSCYVGAITLEQQNEEVTFENHEHSHEQQIPKLDELRLAHARSILERYSSELESTKEFDTWQAPDGSYYVVPVSTELNETRSGFKVSAVKNDGQFPSIMSSVEDSTSEIVVLKEEDVSAQGFPCFFRRLLCCDDECDEPTIVIRFKNDKGCFKRDISELQEYDIDGTQGTYIISMDDFDSADGSIEPAESFVFIGFGSVKKLSMEELHKLSAGFSKLQDVQTDSKINNAFGKNIVAMKPAAKKEGKTTYEPELEYKAVSFDSNSFQFFDGDVQLPVNDETIGHGDLKDGDLKGLEINDDSTEYLTHPVIEDITGTQDYKNHELNWGGVKTGKKSHNLDDQSYSSNQKHNHFYSNHTTIRDAASTASNQSSTFQAYTTSSLNANSSFFTSWGNNSYFAKNATLHPDNNLYNAEDLENLAFRTNNWSCLGALIVLTISVMVL